MPFEIDNALLKKAQDFFAHESQLYWLLGGSGSGKTTITKTLADRYQLSIYDMDAHIYGTYHERFTGERHPVNKAWANTENGMAWLLEMDWDEFNKFHQAALPEYLDLFIEDLTEIDRKNGLLIDGGVWHPALLVQAFPRAQIICLATNETSAEIWEGNPERYTMRKMFAYFPDPEASWSKFLDFDARITATVKEEANSNGIALLGRTEKESVEEFADRVAHSLALP